MISSIYKRKSAWQLRGAPKPKPVYMFLQKTLRNEDVNKEVVRKETHRIFLEFFLRFTGDQISMATLPGLTWDFEKALRNSLNIKNKRLNVAGYEKDQKIFNASSMYMLDEDCNARIIQGVSERTGEHFIYQKKSGLMLWNTDIFAGTGSKDGSKLHGVWYDTTGTVFSFLRQFQEHPPSLAWNAMVAVTVLKGREYEEIATTRTALISEAFAELKLELVYEQEYFDSSPMLHLIYKRECAPERIEPL